MAQPITFKPKQVTKRMLSNLPDIAYEVVVNRFGLTDEAERKTLEAIGKKYGITRERVRQIENSALSMIRKSDSFKNEKAVFEELQNLVHTLGAIVSEDDLLSHVSKDKLTQNHIHLYLTLGDAFTKHKEDDHFKSRWSVDSGVANKVHDAIKDIYANHSDKDLVAEKDLV